MKIRAETVVMLLCVIVLLSGVPPVQASEQIAMKKGGDASMGMMDEHHMSMAGKWTGMRPDGHAPIGVMGDHIPMAGKFMFSFRYMHMNMDENRVGTDRVSDQDVLRDFPVTPTNMDMDMYMLGVMYAPVNRFSLMLMVPYISNEMDHITRTGVRFTTKSQGFGDIKLTGLFLLYETGLHRFQLDGGVSFPTGSINERDDLPTGPNQPLPYPMQIGSGSFGLLVGGTYLGQIDDWSWGAQLKGVIWVGDNYRDYRLGNRFGGTGWFAYKWSDYFSSSIRIEGQDWGNISGADPDLNPNVVPTADPNLRGGSRIDLMLGTNFFVSKGRFKGIRLGVEGGFPVYQDLDGPQLETDWLIWAGLKYMF